MTTDYDRISADDLTHQTEERLDQTEGGQTTGPVKTARKKATSSAKPASGKRTSKKRSRKTAAGQDAAEARAQAKWLADQQDILHQRIQTIFERGPAPDNGKRKRAAKAEATGLVWTLSALAQTVIICFFPSSIMRIWMGSGLLLIIRALIKAWLR